MNHVFPLDTSSLIYKIPELDLLVANHYSDNTRTNYGSLREVKSLFLAYDGDPESNTKLETPYYHPLLCILQAAVTATGNCIEDVHYAYYCLMPPKTKIYTHIDVGAYYSTINRYQLFFSVTKDNIVVQENNKTTSNAVVYFNQSKPHSFINESTDDNWRFFVFDIYKSKDKNI